MARPSKPYRVKDNNKPVRGLSRGKDGRWRFQLNGKDVKFSEPDANMAVNRYLRATPARRRRSSSRSRSRSAA